MRRSIVRRTTRGGFTPAQRALRSGAIQRRDETEADCLARLTREIAEETGAQAAVLLGLIERRAVNVTPAECAEFILSEWRKDGESRARLLGHAMKTPAHLAAERTLAEEIRVALQPLAGKHLNSTRPGEARAAVVRLMRAKLPRMPIAILKRAVEEAIEDRTDRLVVRTDGLVALIVPSPAAS